MYGTQANLKIHLRLLEFENDVKMYGTQAAYTAESLIELFENDVKMYGTQADSGQMDI